MNSQPHPLKLANAFSLSMLPKHPADIRMYEVTPEAAGAIARGFGVTSYVGHDDTARVFAEVLGVPVVAQRASLKLPGYGAPLMERSLLVGQYSGPRLPEGATELPEGATIRWIIVVHGAPMHLPTVWGWVDAVAAEIGATVTWRVGGISVGHAVSDPNDPVWSYGATGRMADVEREAAASTDWDGYYGPPSVYGIERIERPASHREVAG